MKTDSTNTDTALIAASVAPEDLRRGDYIAVLNEIVEFPSFFWFDTEPGERCELVRIRYLPTGDGLPLKVKAVCLPFVFVKPPLGHGQSIDIRRVRLVRVTKGYAKTVWKSVRKQQSRMDLPENGR